ncbi:protein SHI RELATED SEQUENCE 3-like [Arachis stenosperma]|uniref:protein SHI RELATED SEQUENCE 3-like n=1 Tax=Arachis stenosperma TaxID=217475 RepID=UPI0025ABE122|nr:protein SHI RELATED SEQUENCE 3-like [Arachis stenosperma]
MPTATNSIEKEEEETGIKGDQSSTKCQDCGNQAKKECSYWRCRTCCKNKGFHCQTHIKSTWVPVDRRRHREVNNHFQLHHPHISKKHKHFYSPSPGVEDKLKLPSATNSMAIFRRVEVRSMDHAVNEIGYQTCVNIGGHVFSGLLYDHGPPAVAAAPFLDHHHQQNLNHGASMGPVDDVDEPFLPPPPLSDTLRTPYFSFPKP